MVQIIPQLSDFAETWQIVHLTGKANYEQVKARGSQGRISCRIVDYWDDMADLYAAADLLIGRAGGVSVAEYMGAGVPNICLPYPYHKDRHQYHNAEPLVQAGAARIVDDFPKEPSRTAPELLGQLREIMNDGSLRDRMAAAARSLAKPDAAQNIANSLRGLID
jgi:UDP-N-acetylglucosamine--N-acetylmuramyl-(pentapeptide) pyrophosphoryl-undecaprenol N-acetylglucosamine transferase